MANQNQILNNLKTIHTLQSSGSILSFLREIRASKVQTESLQSKLDSSLEALKQAEAIKQAEKSVEEKPEIKEEVKPEISESEEVKATVQNVKEEEKKPTFDRKQNFNKFEKPNFDKNNFDRNNKFQK